MVVFTSFFDICGFFFSPHQTVRPLSGIGSLKYFCNSCEFPQIFPQIFHWIFPKIFSQIFPQIFFLDIPQDIPLNIPLDIPLGNPLDIPPLISPQTPLRQAQGCNRHCSVVPVIPLTQKIFICRKRRKVQNVIVVRNYQVLKVVRSEKSKCLQRELLGVIDIVQTNQAVTLQNQSSSVQITLQSHNKIMVRKKSQTLPLTSLSQNLAFFTLKY